MNDLSEFVQNNKALKFLSLNSVQQPVSLEQSTALSRTIASAQLESISIWECCFENNASFEQMLEG
jgi:hypothetical protein